MEYSQLFAFKYSERPGTAAARLKDDVPEDVKKSRLKTLLDTHAVVAAERNRKMIGRTLECLVTGAGKKPHLDGEQQASGFRLQASGAAEKEEAEDKETASPSSAGGFKRNGNDNGNDEVIQLSSRSPGNQIVFFRGARRLIGTVVPVRIVRSSALTLFGEIDGQ
jgi:tRNA A37 methylthiotransferase MiaB